MDIKSIQQMVLLVAMIALAIMMLLTLIVSIIGPVLFAVAGIEPT